MPRKAIKWNRKENTILYLSIVGILLTAVGLIGTFYPVLGYMFLWGIFLALGGAIVIFSLWKITARTREVMKTFGERWRISDGQLKIGSTVNVALRSKTVQELLNAFLKAFPDDYYAIVKDAGKNAGKRFADDLKNELTTRGFEIITQQDKTPELLKEKLFLWAEYDSSTGMGIFEPKMSFTVGGLEGYILLKNSFLAYEKKSEEPTCVFIEGYLEGVIGKLLGVDIIAKEVKCHSQTGTGRCMFEIAKK